MRFKISKDGKSKPFRKDKACITRSNWMDGNINVWCWRIITGVNLYFSNEQRDEYLLIIYCNCYIETSPCHIKGNQ